MDNNAVAAQFSLLAKLMDIHGENSFKTKNYSNAAFQVERLERQLQDMTQAEIASVKGIGDSAAKKITELLNTGKMAVLEEYIASTPAGIIEMMNIKGIGAKKIQVIWKEMEIETVGELLYACNENRLTRFKGFGEKTQNNVKEAIEFYMSKLGFYLYRDASRYAQQIMQILHNALPSFQFAITGEISRQLETVETIELLTDANNHLLEQAVDGIENIQIIKKDADRLFLQMDDGPAFTIISTSADKFGTALFVSSSPSSFIQEFTEQFNNGLLPETNEEISLFRTKALTYIPPFLRDHPNAISLASEDKTPAIIQPGDIRGIIHCHSSWSDGEYTLEQMAEAAIASGYEYLVISDHSRSAGYANGLNIDRVLQQHEEIEYLNAKLFPFKIFKSIESDILGDGSLDYPDEILERFDLVIASVHSNLKMTEDKATARLLSAINNKYTTILGHMTGRLLLSRAGYPVDYKTIIDACAANEVVIELNANPRRLDMDWRWIPYALEKSVMISIDPDAHFIEKFRDVEYGVLSAQKAMLTAAQNLSSFTLQEFENYVTERKARRLGQA